jgi:hypothetical protein
MAKRWLESQQKPIYFLDAQGNRYTIDNLLVFPDQVPAVTIAELGAELETAGWPGSRLVLQAQAKIGKQKLSVELS